MTRVANYSMAGSARRDQGQRTGVGVPPVTALGIIGQMASHLLEIKRPKEEQDSKLG